MRSTPEQLGALQHTPERIRNICILAHVDHGKTTLSDSLVSTNGIISERLAGKVRYLDNTEEEQLRGITMKSSAISLLYPSQSPAATATGDAPFLINLVDSPGHVDFSFDVSTAVRLCDGALLLIDAVEGVCAQTQAVMRQAYTEGIRPCLVLNKLDRLISEVQFSPMEAYQRLCRIVEQTNAVLSTMIRMDVLKKYDEKGTMDGQMDAAMAQKTQELEKELLFAPSKGNVIFASATDGWAFSIGYFAALYASKLDVPVRTLRQALWGDFYYHAKLKKIQTKPPTAKSQPMFCSFILDLIWTTYTTLAQPVASDDAVDQLRKLTRQLRIAKGISDRDLKHTDRKLTTQLVMRKWLPIATTVLNMVTRVLPSPVRAQAKRAEKLLCRLSIQDRRHAQNSLHDTPVFQALQSCATSDDAPLIVYICKVISVEASALSDYRDAGLSPTEEVYVGIGRVYSGVFRAGQAVYVLDPKFTGLSPDQDVDALDRSKLKHVTCIERGVLKPYMMMGRELHHLKHVPAGNIVGIVGLQDHVVKTATLSSTLACCSLTKMPYQAKPIVRVAVEPEDPRHFEALEAGLQRLYRSDPTVEVHVQETGEHVIVALGELHLERCIKDLKERFAKIPVHVSEPLVGFRESIGTGTISACQETLVFKDLLTSDTTQKEDSFVSKVDETNSNMKEWHDTKAALGTTPDGTVTLKLQTLPLPLETAQLLEEHAQELGNMKVDVEKRVALQQKLQKSLATSKSGLLKALNLDQIWSLGPRRIGPNILINNIAGYHVSEGVFKAHSDALPISTPKTEEIKKLENSIVTGFQMASSAGPLCAEPVWGVAFILDDVIFHDKSKNEPKAEGEKVDGDKYGPLSGQVISTMRTTCLMAFVKQPVRLVEAVYECIVQCQAEQLGKLYSVISKRRGEIYAEELSDGTALFTVKAHLPVVESFGFATDVMTQTSGAASNPQLIFSHWSVIDIDPFFQPQTEEEREDYGERVYEHNFVRRYIEAIRKRKGLSRDEKIVIHAEKQRTLKR